MTPSLTYLLSTGIFVGGLAVVALMLLRYRDRLQDLIAALPRPADPARDRKAMLSRLGILFQNPDQQILFPTVAEELAFGLAQQGHRDAETQARAALAQAQNGSEIAVQKLSAAFNTNPDLATACVAGNVMASAFWLASRISSGRRPSTTRWQ